MARIARVVVPDYPHHVTQRGVRSMAIFSDDEDRRLYLEFVREQTEKLGVEILGWCLMTNHADLVAVPSSEDGLARGIGNAHKAYTRMRNFREGVRGYLFQGRFWSCVLDEPHLIATIRYIERNPVRARLIKKAWDWPWSSASFSVGDQEQDRLVGERDPFGIVLHWRELLLEHPREMDFIREQSRTGRPCRSDGFISMVERLTGRRLRPSPGGRPRRPRR